MSKAAQLVRSIIKEHGPISVQDIYKRAIANRAPEYLQDPSWTPGYYATPPPHADHVVSSMSFLKHKILPALAQQSQVRKTHMQEIVGREEETRILLQRGQKMKLRDRLAEAAMKGSTLESTASVSVWRWEWVAEQNAEKQALKAAREAKTSGWKAESHGLKVQERPISHLNKRRQLARPGKIQREQTLVDAMNEARVANSTHV